MSRSRIRTQRLRVTGGRSVRRFSAFASPHFTLSFTAGARAVVAVVKVQYSADHLSSCSPLPPLAQTDVNRKDYRAWYGLGQTYELLGEPFYALDYYQRATALRPYDARMWSALAGCYEKLKRCVSCLLCSCASIHSAFLAGERRAGTWS
jgi:hypothetical protein